MLFERGDNAVELQVSSCFARYILQVRKILVEKDICVRGLAHPAVSGVGTERFMEKLKQQDEDDKQQVQEHYFTNQTTKLSCTLHEI